MKRKSDINLKWTAVMLIAGIVLWNLPVPEGLTGQAWHLFAIFITAILAVMVKAMPIFVAAILAMAASIFTGTLTPEQAYSGFSKDFILLIVAAFLVSSAVIKSGLGTRMAYHVIRRLGKSTLGLGYSMAVTDAIIAPAFPSNTARSGVLYPIIRSICVGAGSSPEDGTEKKMGNFLMMNGIAGLTISSALWLTAMAANPTGAAIAVDYGVTITFGSWFLASLAPSLVALVGIPYLLFRVMKPEVRSTPDAPREAKAALAKMGPMSRDEIITAIVFVFMVLAWVVSDKIGIDKGAIAFLGLGALMLAGIYTLSDLKKEGQALSIWIWFGVLFTLSTFLNEFGFMVWLGDKIAGMVEGFGPVTAYILLVLAYVLLHYFFVSQTAHLLALYGVFLAVGIAVGVKPSLLAYMLLFATNWFAAITPQGSSANVLFAGSGYLRTSELYKYGGLVTAANTVIYVVIGTAWILLLGL
jgi:DASS family divalent anion:Na+ symporter